MPTSAAAHVIEAALRQVLSSNAEQAGLVARVLAACELVLDLRLFGILFCNVVRQEMVQARRVLVAALVLVQRAVHGVLCLSSTIVVGDVGATHARDCASYEIGLVLVSTRGLPLQFIRRLVMPTANPIHALAVA